MKTFSNYITESVQEKMHICFDTEFTGLTKDADIISIGLVAENGNTFYAELTDFDIAKCSGWVLDNVVAKLKYYNREDNLSKSFLKRDFKNYIVVGNKDKVKTELILWFECLKASSFTMIADCLAWDWVLFNDLMADYSSGMPVLPCNISYIPIDICTMLIEKNLDPDLDRSEYIGSTLEEQDLAHNSLHDAMICQKTYNKLKGN